MEKAERRRNNNKTKKRGVMLGGRGGEGRQAWRAEKNLTGSPLVGLGSPNNSVRPLNKQQFGVIARHPPGKIRCLRVEEGTIRTIVDSI